MIFERPPLETIPPAKERWTPLFLEHGKIEVDDSSVKWIGAQGDIFRIPVATLSALLLGPGTTITHEAIKACVECDTPVCWVGHHSMHFYAIGKSTSHSNENARLQALLNSLFPLKRQKTLKKSCSLVYDAIESKNYEVLLNLLPIGHKVRLLYDLFESALFVDVETNGLANDSYVTCISMLFNNECKTFIKDVNMCDFIPYLNQSSLVVTFNGERFDIPFLLKTFGPLRLPPHIDLMAECKPYGYHGSLKK